MASATVEMTTELPMGVFSLYARSPDFILPNLSGETAVSPKVNPSAESRHYCVSTVCSR